MPTPVQWSPVFDVDSTRGEASEAQVTVLANGDILAVWKQAMPDGDFDIFMRRYDASGAPLGEVVQVNVTDMGWQDKPVVTALANGGFAIAWVDHQVGDTDVRFRIYDQAGQPLSDSDTDAYGILSGNNNQTAPVITATGIGFAIGFVGSAGSPTGGVGLSFNEMGTSTGGSTYNGPLTLMSIAAPTGEIYEKRPVVAYLTSDGRIGLHTQYNNSSTFIDDTGRSIIDVAVTTLPTGGYMVTWISRSEGNDLVKARIYDAEGAVITSGNSTSQGTRTLIESSVDLSKVVVSSYHAGGFALAFAQTDGKVNARTFDNLGVPTGEMVSATPNVGFNHAQPSIAVMKDGRFIIGFLHALQGGASDSFMSILDPRVALTSSNVIDGDGNDQYAGTIHNDVLISGKGNDTLYGGAGGDRLSGGEGADKLDGGAHVDMATYEFWTSATNEGIVLNLHDTSQSTGEAKDDFYDSIEQFSATKYNDTIIGAYARYNEVFGGNGNDTMVGGDGGNWLFGEGGDDRLYSGAGADKLWGGTDVNPDAASGFDIVSYENAAGAVKLDFRAGRTHSGEAEGDTFRSIDAFVGSTHNDEMIGSTGQDAFYGDAGNDTLTGGDGNDTLVGEAGNDVLYAGTGEDVLYGDRQSPNRMSGTYNVVSYADVTERIVLNLEDRSKDDGAVKGDWFFHIDAFHGTNAGDTMIGGDKEDEFYGGAGGDRLEGGLNRDYLFGEAGNDTLQGGAGNDVLNGGAGLNTAVFSGARSEYIVTRVNARTITVTDRDGSEGTDTLTDVRVLQFGGVTEVVNFAPTSLSLSVASIDENAPKGAEVGTLSAADADGDKLIYSLAPGSSSAFAIVGNKLVVNGPLDYETQRNHQVTILADDGFGGKTTLTATITVTNKVENTPFTILGTPGADVLTGESGNDTIYGSGANDVLSGMDGNDKIHGGTGRDQLSGGAGRDVFVFDTRANKRTNVDKIDDFRSQDDSIYLENRYFTKLGSGTASKPKKFNSDMFVQNTKAQDAEDRIVYDKRSGKLYYDEDGTGSKAQILIATLTNKATLKYHDFFVI